MSASASPTSAAARAVHLLALCGFAFLQPVLDVLGGNPGFLVARKLGPAEILALVGVVALAPPLLLWGLERVAALASPRAETLLHGVFVAGLAMAIAAPLVNRSGTLTPPVDLAVIFLAGGMAVVLYSRVAAVRMFLGVLGVAPLLFAGIFVFQSSASSLFVGGGPQRSAAIPVESQTPIVFVVFDELPLSSLLDEAGAVDAARYPAFARLAATSHWFRGAAAVDWRTLQVLPTILSGRYPLMHKRLPMASEHPYTLFSLLAPHYRMNVVETHTQLFDGEGRVAPFSVRGPAALRDLSLVYLHVVLPARFAEALPTVSRTWKDFGAGDAASGGEAHESGTDRVAALRSFVRSIDDQPASLHFIHIMLPHSPWQYVPGGGSYAPSNFEGATFGIWLDEPWWAMQAQQRHLLQLEVVDRLLGELLDRLEELGILDEALVVVTADHGVSFWTTGAYRDLAQAVHPEDIINVPLFVKAPRQHEAVVHERAVESVDVLPLVLDLLEVEVPWQLDGCSPLAAGCPERTEVVAFSELEYASESNQRLTHPAGILRNDESLRLKLERFGSGRTPGALFRVGPHSDWVGREAAPLIDAGGASSVGAIRLSEGVQASPVPHRLHGILELNAKPAPDEAIDVAVVVDGVIEAVVPAITDGRNELRRKTGFAIKPERIVSAMLASGGEAKTLRVYLVEGGLEPPRLHPLELR